MVIEDPQTGDKIEMAILKDIATAYIERETNVQKPSQS